VEFHSEKMIQLAPGRVSVLEWEMSYCLSYSALDYSFLLKYSQYLQFLSFNTICSMGCGPLTIYSPRDEKTWYEEL